VWNVVAAPEFSVSPQRWCFPIAGCVAYRGYFNERSARKFAESLQEKGFDTYVGGVAAYSTLGKFKDPVLNTMLGYGDDELAAIIFHELAHQLIYVANDSEFNEAFATTVEQAGLERWLKLRGREADLGRFTAKRERQAQIIALFIGARTKLAALYKMKLAPDAMRARKREIFDRLDEQIADLEKRLGIRTSYRNTEKGLNNAYLASIATYYDCVPGFERLLESKGGDLPSFYDAVRELTKKPREERHELLCQTPPSVTQPSVTQPSITGTPAPGEPSDDSDSAGSARSSH
jgi:predicted aminopeptidase